MSKRKRPFTWKDLLKGKALKRAAIERVLDNSGDWCIEAQKIVLHLCETRAGEEMLGEEISAEIIAGAGRPPHHNALGGIGNWYVTAGLVIRVGWKPMRLPRSHARLTPVYRLVHPRDVVPPDERAAAE